MPTEGSHNTPDGTAAEGAAEAELEAELEHWRSKYRSLAMDPGLSPGSVSSITPGQWRHFDEFGWVVLPPEQVGWRKGELAALARRLDDVQLGRADVPYDEMMMQLDSSTGRYEDSGRQTFGFKGPSLRYRKIQNLEHCPVIMEWLRRPVFREACRRIYGPETPIASFRTMFFNKPCSRDDGSPGGTNLPWHQDRWSCLDKDPLLNIYLAIDPAVPESGCVKIKSSSHKLGVLNPAHHSAFLTPAMVDEYLSDDPSDVRDLWLFPGEVALIHNWVVHCSGVNATRRPRRALSVSYMDAGTKCSHRHFAENLGGAGGYAAGQDTFPLIFEAAV